jgi:hypothetical protein
MNAIETMLIWFAKTCSLTLLAVLYVTFMAALFNGAGAAIITVNDYGEGMVELVVFSLTAILIVAGYVCEWRAKRKE